MTRRRHELAIAQLVAAAVEAEPQRGSRRLRASRLRCAAQQPEERLARELGVLSLVEEARDRHLATLDADDGLAALGVAWEEIVRTAVELLDRPASTHCSRCGARLSRRRRVCARCRSPVPKA